MMLKIYAIENIFRSHKPFQSYQLTGQAYKQQKNPKQFLKKIPLLHEIEMHLLLLCPIVIWWINIKISWFKITIWDKKFNNLVTKCYFNRKMKKKTWKKAQKVDFWKQFGVLH